MPRLARTVFPGVLHHTTQRGNRREDVFYHEEVYQTYLDWLCHYSQQLDILAYRLMTNDIHIVAVPSNENSLQLVLKPLHMRSTQRINRMRKCKGHFWQGRYFSSPLDERHMWAAIRYVERNPVRARMERRAEDYLWSSAVSHCGRLDNHVLSINPQWLKLTEKVDDRSVLPFYLTYLIIKYYRPL